jgi:hypothetical protein
MYSSANGRRAERPMAAPISRATIPKPMASRGSALTRERADIAESRFDTLSVLGVDAETGKYFARSFENHGFYRHYQIDRVGDVWTLTGDTERATTTFVDKGRTQKIVWEWKRDGVWLPLCDRTAVRID